MRYCLLLLLTFLFTTKAANAQITGAANVCVSATTALSCSPAGGTWSTGSPGIATVDASGVVAGVAAGTAIITYDVASTITTRVVTVNPLPGAITSASGSLTVCEGGTRLLSSASSSTGIWSSVETAIASIDPGSGLISGLTPGTTTVQYMLPTTCAVSAIVTVNAAPVPVSGAASLCAGTTTTLADLTLGGTWISSNTSVATIGGTSGVVNALTAGTVTMSYVLTGTGCVRIHNMTVNTLPTAITGSPSICAGGFVNLVSSPGSGSWSSSNTSVVTIHPVTGVASGSAAGTANITYTLAGTGCATSRVQTVTPTPSAIIGPSIVCEAGGITLSNTVSGGTWVTGTPSVAAIFPSGSSVSVMGVVAGTSVITYSTGPSCQSVKTITVNPLPAAGTVSGPSIVCAASSISLAASVPGGTWSTASPLVNVSSGGVVTGIGTGTALVTYSVSNSCGTANTTHTVTVSIPPSAITGVTEMCAGTANVLVNSVPGGTWSSSSLSVATIGVSSGLVTGLIGGTAVISYAISPGCQSTTVITINSAPSTITGPANVCVGAYITLTNTTSGGVWTSSAPALASVGVIGISTGSVLGITAGSTIITYSVGSCSAYKVVTVNGLPSVSATAVPDACGGGYTLSATGAFSYSWSPATGVGCPVCATTALIPSSSVTYTVTGTNSLGCNSTDTVQINGNRIFGHVSFTAAMPSVPDLKVWLVQYNPADSIITATDSTTTCLDGSTPFFQFNNVPAGNYMVKARLLSSIPGTSDYVPTYGTSATIWSGATTIAHTANSDEQSIAMQFGTVPAGPGFIGGNVYSGAGKGTSGEIPEAGMLIFLKDAVTGAVLTYTYTNAAGYYSFSGIGLGDYIVYPEEGGYHTTPSASVSIGETSISVTGLSFRKHTTSRTIYPYSSTGTQVVSSHNSAINVYPNPAKDIVNIHCGQQKGSATITISDVAGRVLQTHTTDLVGGIASGLNVSGLNNGVYLVNITTTQGHSSARLTIAHN